MYIQRTSYENILKVLINRFYMNLRVILSQWANLPLRTGYGPLNIFDFLITSKNEKKKKTHEILNVILISCIKDTNDKKRYIVQLYP